MSRNILVPIDFSDVTELVLSEACRLARALDAKLWLVHVATVEPTVVGCEVGVIYVRDEVADGLRSQHRKLRQYEVALRDEGLDATAMLVQGKPTQKILEQADRLDADMIVLGSHGHGAMFHLLAGSVCESLMRKASCPVVVVPSRMAAKGRAPV